MDISLTFMVVSPGSPTALATAFMFFLKLHSVNDVNQHRLVRSKMANIFKPGFRRHLFKNSSEASQGIFSREEAMFKNIEESKKQSVLMRSIMLQTKMPGKGGNPT